jgi:hypothetical protein
VAFRRLFRTHTRHHQSENGRGIARPIRIKVKVLVSKSQTQARHQTTPSKPSRKPEWRPQPIGLTRHELREIVADMIG